MILNRKALVLYLLFFICFSSAYAQVETTLLNRLKSQIEAYSTKSKTEQVFLHFDEPYYYPGDTIKFKAYLLLESTHQLSLISKVLYVDLIDFKDSIISSNTLRLVSGVALGNLVLPPNYLSPVCRVRAFTKWMLNDPSFISYDLLPIHLDKNGHDFDLNQSMNNSKIGMIDIKFNPEGGSLVYGLKSKIAFQITDKNHFPLNLTGSIVDELGNVVSKFNCQDFGMGAFWLKPTFKKKYFAKLLVGQKDTLIELPKISEVGSTLSLNKVDDSIYLKFTVNEDFYRKFSNKPFFILAQSGFKIYFSASSILDFPIFTTHLSKSVFPSGIVQFTIISSNGEVLNDRLFFNKNKDSLNISFSIDKNPKLSNQGPFLKIIASDSAGHPVLGIFSCSAHSLNQHKHDSVQTESIYSKILLTSESSEEFLKPNYLFQNGNEKADQYLDLLMLTHEFRRFIWADSIYLNKKPIYNFEDALELSGTINTISGKPISSAPVRMTSLKNLLVLDTVSNGTGEFVFKHLNFSDTTTLIISAKDNKGTAHVKIKINEQLCPVVRKSTISTFFLNNQQYQSTVDRKISISFDDKQIPQKSIQLKDVLVKEKKEESPTYTNQMHGAAISEQTIYGKNLSACNNLVECLRGKLFGVTFTASSSGTVLPYKTPINYSRPSPMAILLNGSRISGEEFSFINPLDVYSIEVIASSKALQYTYGISGAALLITMKTGTSIVHSDKGNSEGIIRYRFKGYQMNLSPDLNSIYNKNFNWAPNIISDSTGKSFIPVKSWSSNQEYIIRIEGLDSDGNLGSKISYFKIP